MMERDEIVQFPKLELHLHLEGAAPPAFIRDLAKRRKIDIAGVFDDQGQYRWTGFGGFLSTYDAVSSALTGPQDFHDLTLCVLEHAAGQGVIYTEAFLSPDFCGGGDVIAWRDYLAAIEAAAHLSAFDVDVDVLVKHGVGIAGLDEAAEAEADEHIVQKKHQ